MGFIQLTVFFFFIVQIQSQTVKSQQIDKIYPGFKASQAEFATTNGVFLVSNTSIFALGFYSAVDPNSFQLGITHILSSRLVWTANRDSPVNDSAHFVFNESGNAFLEGANWSTITRVQDAVSMQLLDSGNLVLQSGNGSFVWQSFHHPTDTLLPGQVFWEGMKLRSYPNGDNLPFYLEMKRGNLVLYVEYNQNPQIYWSFADEPRKIQRSAGGYLLFAVLTANSWNFHDQNGELFSQFLFFWQSNWKDRWAIVLNTDGSITFHNLELGESAPPEPTRIPAGYCSVPAACDPYFVCYFDNRCQCPSILNKLNCKFSGSVSCNGSGSSTELLYVGENLDYFALPFSIPSLKSSDLATCKASCIVNCSCHVMFFNPISGNCFFFDQIGSFRRSDGNSGGYISYMKMTVHDGGDSNGDGGGMNRSKHIVLMSMLLAGIGLTFVGLFLFRCYRGKINKLLSSVEDSSEEDNFLDLISGGPVRFSFRQLRRATGNFSRKIGGGGFGSVYLGVLPNGARVAVKKLERNGEFRAEVGLIRSIRHVNVVKLRGFCSERRRRILVYEYMSNGSLDKWIFRSDEVEDGLFLDWDTRFNVALGIAKALAYLHEECEPKIIHCDIKPENVLLDDDFTAKLSDFGLAKPITGNQTSVYTYLRGTRGYVAPEWITNQAISDKSDVYSYGLVLLEIVGGRKSYDADEPPEKAQLAWYAAKMAEEGKVRDIVDPRMAVEKEDERVETAIGVALWCLKEEVDLRPPMRKVVQVLEGVSGGASWTELGSSLNGQISEVRLSDVRLSGTR